MRLKYRNFPNDDFQCTHQCTWLFSAVPAQFLSQLRADRHRADAQTCVVGDGCLEEGYGACLLFVEHDLDEGDTRCIIDANMDEFPANATTVALTGTIAGDAMADPIDLAEFLDVDMAMTRRPEVFEGVRCMVSPQPLSGGVALERALEQFGIPLVDDLNERIRLQRSFTLDQFSPVPWAKGVTIPTFLYQVQDDFYTRPDDIQAMYDNIPIADKKLYWIEGTKRRWDGYTYFQREPRQMLE